MAPAAALSRPTPRASVSASRPRARLSVRATAFRLISGPRFAGSSSASPAGGLGSAGQGKAQRGLALSSLDGVATAQPATTSAQEAAGAKNVQIHGVHHVALICENLERSLEFYQGLLELETNPDRPHAKLPYRGAWLWVGTEMLHLMELPNPDPTDKEKRPEHGGRDRHCCLGVANLDSLAAKLEAAGVTFTRSMSGRPAIFFRDPDANCLECVELEPWR